MLREVIISGIGKATWYSCHFVLALQSGLVDDDRFDGAWCAADNDPNPWLSVDAGSLALFTGVITQGRASIWSYV